MASISGLGSPQSGASDGFSGILNILCLTKGTPKPEKKDLPLDMALSCISGDAWMEQTSRWNRPLVECPMAGRWAARKAARFCDVASLINLDASPR